jgi:isocitrate/isopropylmalate dehydrogenase
LGKLASQLEAEIRDQTAALTEGLLALDHELKVIRANPMAAVLSAALLLRDRGAGAAADRVEASVDAALVANVRTPDLGGAATTEEVGRWLAEFVLSPPA